MSISTVSVIGAGTMGVGIAQVTAVAGYQVILYDLEEGILTEARQRIGASLDKGVARGYVDGSAAAQALDTLRLTTTLEDAAASDLVIEAVPEDLALKRDLFRRLDDLTPPDTLLASNTSSLSISALGGATQRPEQVLGLHFFNPVHIMKLVEIVRGDLTGDETIVAGRQFVDQLGKTGVLVKDTPGFIVNRVARPFYGEAFRLLGEGAADVATIDRLVRSLGFRMGPFELVDLIGCDVNLAVTKSVYEAYFHEPRYRPHPIQQRMVDSGRLGRKSGRGFYNYEE
ncbi:MAG: 3-hydroxyacyl-CoA dehydrogenase NAD-binding domain-containing protein [Candidatus Promineifilaceae bacterium]|nr:3-hydroxyacyl-CoA dehydrogenase NAD-binding domain-containing protein [Candidatus Promineifilaceae bacterium]